MLRVNPKTGHNWNAGDVYSYNGNEYTISVIRVKVKEIRTNDSNISLSCVLPTGKQVSIPFWYSSYGKDQNIMQVGNGYKLIDVQKDYVLDVYGFEYEYLDAKTNKTYNQINPIGGYVKSEETFQYTVCVDNQKLLAKINMLISVIKDDALRKTCVDAFTKYSDEFLEKPAAHSHHHAYVGGLLQHTYEVMAAAYEMSKVYAVDTDVVLTATFLHDMMKVKEYTLDREYLIYGKMEGHVVGSASLFRDLALYNGVSEEKINAVFHAMLAHHGMKEWGSPVEPSTPEAVMVFMSDFLSSRMNPLYIARNQEGNMDYYLN